MNYEAPSIQLLGNVAEMTLGGTTPAASIIFTTTTTV